MHHYNINIWDDDKRCISWFRKKNRETGLIDISIVSHGHGQMVESLINSLLNYEQVTQIILTKNVPEFLELPDNSKIKIIENDNPKGFGENHNSAFEYSKQPFFCILNPDIEFKYNPFKNLILLFEDKVALVSPLIVSKNDIIEDSVRKFPTLLLLILKVLKLSDGTYDIKKGEQPFSPEWIAGMFMLFTRDDFILLNGFDEDFYLYYEDVDICVRIWKNGKKIKVDPTISVIHNAQRDSRKKISYMRYHLSSMIRYFKKHFNNLPTIY